MKMWRFVLAALMLCKGSLAAETEETRDLSAQFGPHAGAFTLYDAARDRWIRYQPEQCRTGTSPCSTFKISGGKDPSGRTARKITESILTSLQILLPHE